jgi:hypothetical protein
MELKIMLSRNLFNSILIISVCWALSAQAAPQETASSPQEGIDDQPVRLPAVESSSLPGDAGFVVDGAQVEDRRSALVRWWNYQAKPHLQASHWGYPEFFEEMPWGSSVRAHQCAQIASGLQNRLMLYQYDFHEGSVLLNRQGQLRLRDLAAAYPHWSHHRLVIESTPDHPQLAIARRNHVMKWLHDHDVPARVEVGSPSGLLPFGDELILTNKNLLRQLQTGGMPMSTGGGRSGGGSGIQTSQPN